MDANVAADKTGNLNEAKVLAEKHDAQAVVVLFIDKKGVATASMWSDTPEKNRAVDGWLRGFISNLPKNPFQTVFGWGKHGVPTPE